MLRRSGRAGRKKRKGSSVVIFLFVCLWAVPACDHHHFFFFFFLLIYRKLGTSIAHYYNNGGTPQQQHASLLISPLSRLLYYLLSFLFSLSLIYNLIYNYIISWYTIYRSILRILPAAYVHKWRDSNICLLLRYAESLVQCIFRKDQRFPQQRTIIIAVDGRPNIGLRSVDGLKKKGRTRLPYVRHLLAMLTIDPVIASSISAAHLVHSCIAWVNEINVNHKKNLCLTRGCSALEYERSLSKVMEKWYGALCAFVCASAWNPSSNSSNDSSSTLFRTISSSKNSSILVIVMV